MKFIWWVMCFWNNISWHLNAFNFTSKWSFSHQCRNIAPFLLLCMILLHFIFVREIVENEMTQVSVDNFKEIRQLKILWVLQLIKWRPSCETNLVTLRCSNYWNIMETHQNDAFVVKASHFIGNSPVNTFLPADWLFA